MKKQKGYKITVFEVTVKHQTHLARKWLALDLADRARDYEEVKAARAKVSRTKRAAR